MPKSPKWKKLKHYNNGAGQTSNRASRRYWWEVMVGNQRLKVSAPTSRKNPCTVGGW